MPFDLAAERLHLEPRDCLLLAGLLGVVGIGAAVVAARQAHAELPPPAVGGRQQHPTGPSSTAAPFSPSLGLLLLGITPPIHSPAAPGLGITWEP